MCLGRPLLKARVTSPGRPGRGAGAGHRSGPRSCRRPLWPAAPCRPAPSAAASAAFPGPSPVERDLRRPAGSQGRRHGGELRLRVRLGLVRLVPRLRRHRSAQGGAAARAQGQGGLRTGGEGGGPRGCMGGALPGAGCGPGAHVGRGGRGRSGRVPPGTGATRGAPRDPSAT